MTIVRNRNTVRYEIKEFTDSRTMVSYPSAFWKFNYFKLDDLNCVIKFRTPDVYASVESFEAGGQPLQLGIERIITPNTGVNYFELVYANISTISAILDVLEETEKAISSGSANIVSTILDDNS